ncbi:hypothetical protein NCER_101906 [Vairimorpha ceranae BRL01]|uniref:Uncharacterized protein n=2 Tax=Vairimorpha ceranae TaxID=40302 RepID=C4VAZ7_VAIC1|nr:hypothetical protein AAJ76_500085410 [Vairimorpha ceranae]EEQ81605.1 hypothetical protein NCER_101906 [Vairimorpha ceranae BRL01]KAF5141017.1 hypothetical protein G9O61_00g008610 [Vairimorpha ceranae]KAF5141506.1 hypothetical protein G9O61_00g003700 [Vairimorpha ceranae]KKO76254.1 hypothetical protein AAJ76_500085410 [Vairimorpha ceranae]
MLLFFILILLTAHTYPLVLRNIELSDNETVVNLVINASNPCGLALCYNPNIDNQEGWKPMIHYDVEVGEVAVELPKTGCYDLYYTFRLVTNEYITFCQPFNYTKKGYKVLNKDYKDKLSQKFSKKKKKLKKKNDNDLLIEWLGMVFVVFIILCLVTIFTSGVGQL